MTELKCPFCGEKLQQTYSFNPTQFWCSNYYDPKHPINLQGTKELWQALIDTKKKLDITMDGLKRIKKLTKPSYKNRNLEALALAVNTFSGEIIERINQRNNNE